MARRSKRILGQHEQEAFLAEAAKWRAACTAMRARAPIGEPFMRSLDGITAAIDGLAEVVTGRRDHLHLKAHSASPLLRSTFGDHAAAPAEPTASFAADVDEEADDTGRGGGE